MREFWQRLVNWFRRQNVPMRIAVGGGVAVLVVGLATVLALSLATPYEPLYYNLGREDAAEVVEFLKKERVPYRLADQGRVVQVPRDQVYELRLRLAGTTMPSGGLGFEIFDRSNLGVTEFVQNVNYQRALQGELARTIRELRQVEAARVHLVLPRESLFVEEQKEATASVILQLKTGRQLDRGQVEGIMRLVAGSVEGLRPENVTVLDTRGTVLSQAAIQPADDTTLTTKQLKFKREYEHTLEQRLQSMLERVVGRRNVVVRAAVSLDFSKVEKTEEIYDPDLFAVRSEHLVNAVEQGQKPVAQGVPGVAANVPEGAGANIGQAMETVQNRTDDQTRNYEISKTVSHTQLPVGTVRNISVAVLVDGSYAAAEGEEKPRFVPRSDEELQVYATMVKKAIGFDRKRGDQVEVASVAFDETSMAEDIKAMKWASYYELGKTAAIYALIAILLLMVYLKIVKPLLAAFSRAVAPVPAPAGGGAADLAAEVKEKVEIRKERTMMDKIADFARENPDEVARIIKIWLKERTA